MKFNPFSLEGKHILITGASSGIGRQCAISCSQMGARITLVARNKERLEETLLQMIGEGHFIISQDISELEKIKDVVDDAVAQNGKIDGFIHSAGIEGTIPINILNEEKYFDYFRINTVAGFEFSKSLSKKKSKSMNGLSIVLLASVMGVVGEPGKVAYCLSKGAVINGVKALALELASKNIRVNSISPGIVETSMTAKAFQELPESTFENLKNAHPIGFGQPEDIANAAIYLLSNASKWVTGSNLIVDGGYCAR